MFAATGRASGLNGWCVTVRTTLTLLTKNRSPGVTATVNGH